MQSVSDQTKEVIQMTDKKKPIDYETLKSTPPDVLLNLSHAELDCFIQETKLVMTNAQTIIDWLCAIRLEKIRRESGFQPAEGGKA